MFSDHPGIRRRVSNLTNCTTARLTDALAAAGPSCTRRSSLQRAGSSLWCSFSPDAGRRDLSSLARDRAPLPSAGRQALYHRTTGEAPKQQTLNNIKEAASKEIRKYFKLKIQVQHTKVCGMKLNYGLGMHTCMYIRKYIILKIRIFKKEE